PRPEHHAFTEAWRDVAAGGAPAPEGGHVILDVSPGPSLVAPAGPSSVSAERAAFGWTGASTPATLTVVRAVDGAAALRVHGTNAHVTASRLADLGVPPLEPGYHFVDLTTSRGSASTFERVP